LEKLASKSYGNMYSKEEIRIKRGFHGLFISHALLATKVKKS
jgi:hypothetical protein